MMGQEAEKVFAATPRVSRRAMLLGAIGAATGGVALFLSGRFARSGSTMTPEQHLQQGLALNRDQQYDQAIRAFTQVIRVRPDSADAYLYRGMAAFQAGRPDASIADFTKALELRPRHAVTYLYRGDSYQALGKRLEAVDDYRRAFALASDDERVAVAARSKLAMLGEAP